MNIIRYIWNIISWMPSKASNSIKLIIKKYMSENKLSDTLLFIFFFVVTFGIVRYCTRRNNDRSDTKKEDFLEEALIKRETIPHEFEEQVRKDLREYGYAVVIKDDKFMYWDQNGFRNGTLKGKYAIVEKDKYEFYVFNREDKDICRKVMSPHEVLALNLFTSMGGVLRMESKVDKMSETLDEMKKDMNNMKKGMGILLENIGRRDSWVGRERSNSRDDYEVMKEKGA